MPAAYPPKTPGVYVYEIPGFPPSVAQVETAIPAFIGYTEKAMNNTESLTRKPTKIKSLVEYEALFGGAPNIQVTEVDLDVNNIVTKSILAQQFIMYDAIRMFFANGGSKCYIESVANYDYANGVTKAALANGISDVEREDEPTLLLFPDAVNLANAQELYQLQVIALKQCGLLQDRFTICDLYRSNEEDLIDFNTKVGEFRNGVGMENLKYGAAYGPYLKTNLDKKITYRNLKGTIKKFGSTIDLKILTTDVKTQSAITNLENAIKDNDYFNSKVAGNLGVIPTLLAVAGPLNNFAAVPSTIDIESISKGYQTVLLDFKNIANTPGSTAAQILPLFLKLYKYIYTVVDKFIDDPAANPGNRLSISVAATATSPAINFILKNIKELITNPLRSTMLTLNGYNANQAHFIEKTGTTSNNVFLDVALFPSWTANEWVDATKNAFVAADVTDKSGDIFKLNPAAGASGDADRIKNMLNAEPFITSIFNNVNDVAMSILSAANAYEKNYEDNLVSVFPILKNMIDKVKNTATSLPPSSSMAGIYATVDANRGVWKAPANVSINNVLSLTQTIVDADQDDLNVDVVAGKSINVIRSFVGRATAMVWGSRTLAGNDNDWRYIPVRRLYIMVEESVKKACNQFVFEPNDANTWTRVRAMIENYLTILWRQGALMGAKPDHAFYVHVGLGSTMTPTDVLEGRMIVEIGMSPVRPAEFIILRFTQFILPA